MSSSFYIDADANRRILVIDDNAAIHDDFQKILMNSFQTRDQEILEMESAIFGSDGKSKPLSLEKDYRIDSAWQGQEALAKVRSAKDRNQPYAVAFVDMRMPPGWDGLRTLQEIWKVDPEMNIVVCTAYSDQSWDDISDAAGESDRLLVLKKPFEPIEVRRLAATLTAKWTLSRQAKLKTDHLESLVESRTSQLHQAATQDSLTGLPNRRVLMDKLTIAMKQRQRDNSRDVAVLMIDMDRFKVVNDSLGHAAGDELLRQVAARLTISTHNSNGSQTTVRLGGDEFCILLTQLSEETDAIPVAQRVINSLSQPYDISGHQIHSAASVGICIASENHLTPDDMVRDADIAMYRAKAAGKGRFMIFDQSMHETALRRMTIENQLRRAIELDQLVPYFQPIHDTQSGEIVAAEALVRWNHPDLGLISPAEIIPIAEDTGLIRNIGDLMLKQSCTLLTQWKHKGLPDGFQICVNVSTRQLNDENFASQVAQIIESTGVSASSVILEITESALAEDAHRANRILHELRNLGVGIYLDDFGTGYSSLSIINEFPMDGLKIDRTFLWNAVNQPRRIAIIQAIASLSKSLNIMLVGEGVENQAQLNLLKSINCDKAQGYLFSKPMPAAEFERYLGLDKPMMRSAA